MQTIAQILALIGGLLFSGEPAPTHENLQRAMLDQLTFQHSKRTGRPKYIGHCHRAPQGCPARVRLFTYWIGREALRQRVDPWTLAALVLHESGGNPYAAGGIGERGLVQIAPGTARKFRGVANWYRDAEHRDACTEILGACQFPFVEAAAIILRRSLDACGSMDAALGRYGSGRCLDGSRYARGVRYHRRRLIEAAR